MSLLASSQAACQRARGRRRDPPPPAVWPRVAGFFLAWDFEGRHTSAEGRALPLLRAPGVVTEEPRRLVAVSQHQRGGSGEVAVRLSNGLNCARSRALLGRDFAVPCARAFGIRFALVQIMPRRKPRFALATTLALAATLATACERGCWHAWPRWLLLGWLLRPHHTDGESRHSRFLSSTRLGAPPALIAPEGATPDVQT